MRSPAALAGGLCLLSAAIAAALILTIFAPHRGRADQKHLASPGWWRPTDSGPDNGPEFGWVLGHPLDIGGAARPRAGVYAPLGVAPRPTVFALDGIANQAATVATLHDMGDKVICYLDVGAAGDSYPAAQEGVAVTYYARLKAAGDLGAKAPGPRGSAYLNINAPSTVSIIESMIRQQCAAKGFDAVEPGADDSYADVTGFAISEAQNVAYDTRLGAYAHRLGLAWGQKNGTHDAAFSRSLEPVADFLLVQECSYFRTCSVATPPYTAADKLVLDAEYTRDWGSDVARDLRDFCPADLGAGIDGTLFTASLAGWHRPCR